MDTKVFWQSKQLWASFFTILNAIILIIREFGGEPPEVMTQAQANQEQLISGIQAIGMFVTGLMAAYYRSADKPTKLTVS